MFLQDLAKKIRGRREKRGLKQQDVANALNISPQAVSKWERGENAPDIAVLAPLARLLDVSVDWLLTPEREQRDTFEATVLTTSVSGAHQRSLGMSPRDFAFWANGLFHQLTEMVLRQDGVPIKYMGDRFLCFFSGSNHARRAVELALQAEAVVTDDLKVGLSTGEIYLGSVGHPDYARPDIMGEVVNIAFLTMEWAEANAPSGIAVTAAVIESLGDDYALKIEKKTNEKFLGLDHPVEVAAIHKA
jgi:class 3 adenylate cyclase